MKVSRRDTRPESSDLDNDEDIVSLNPDDLFSLTQDSPNEAYNSDSCSSSLDS